MGAGASVSKNFAGELESPGWQRRRHTARRDCQSGSPTFTKAFFFETTRTERLKCAALVPCCRCSHKLFCCGNMDKLIKARKNCWGKRTLFFYTSQTCLNLCEPHVEKGHYTTPDSLFSIWGTKLLLYQGYEGGRFDERSRWAGTDGHLSGLA